MSRLAIKAIEDREEYILEPTKAKHREELEAVKEGHRKSMLAQELGFRGQIKTMQEAHKVAMEKEKAKYKKLKLQPPAARTVALLLYRWTRTRRAPTGLMASSEALPSSIQTNQKPEGDAVPSTSPVMALLPSMRPPSRQVTSPSRRRRSRPRRRRCGRPTWRRPNQIEPS